jgi:hypothetical protein
MKFELAALAMAISSASAFQAPVQLARAPVSSRSALNMVEKSASIPFMPKPSTLDGSMAGDVGFDPLGLSSIDFDFSKIIVPDAANMREEGNGLSTLYWMREAELKHGRVAMLAAAGWIAVDMGARFPGSGIDASLSSVTAHNAMVTAGPLVVMLHAVLVLELIGGAAIFEAAKGSGRAAGDFGLDPFGLAKDPKKKATYELNEIKNGRLAMLAFGGMATQAVVTGNGFPYLF